MGNLRARPRIAPNPVVVSAEVRSDQLAARAQGARGIHSGKCAFSVLRGHDTTKFCALATRPVMLRAMRPGLLVTSDISAVRVLSVQPRPCYVPDPPVDPLMGIRYSLGAGSLHRAGC